MQGLIIDKVGNDFFTYMKEFMDVAHDNMSKYNWLISDYECNVYPSKDIDANKEFAWIDGKSLISLINENDIQFVWAVFSAFPKDITLEAVLKYSLPFANGNECIWGTTIRLQNPLAEIEIIAWDSSLLIIRAQSSDLIKKFKSAYPEAHDLKCSV